MQKTTYFILRNDYLHSFQEGLKEEKENRRKKKKKPSQQARHVKMTSNWRQCDVLMSHRRSYDAI